MTNPATMTVQECMDFVALQNPIYRVTRGGAKGPRGEPVDLWEEKLNPVDWFVIEGEEGWPEHPLSPTLDSAAAAMPEGWDWTVSKGMDVNRNYSAEAFDTKAKNGHEFVEDCETELLARWRLVVACMLAEKEVGDE